MSSANINIYLPEINNFCYIKKCRFRVHFKSLFAFILSLFESWNVVMINMVAMLTMWRKLATLGHYKNTIIWKRIWCQNLSVRSPKINYITQVILQMWSCDQSNSSISMREVIIAKALRGVFLKKNIFFSCALGSSSII